MEAEANAKYRTIKKIGKVGFVIIVGLYNLTINLMFFLYVTIGKTGKIFFFFRAKFLDKSCFGVQQRIF